MENESSVPSREWPVRKPRGPVGYLGHSSHQTPQDGDLMMPLACLFCWQHAAPVRAQNGGETRENCPQTTCQTFLTRQKPTSPRKAKVLPPPVTHARPLSIDSLPFLLATSSNTQLARACMLTREIKLQRVSDFFPMHLDVPSQISPPSPHRSLT